MNTKVVILAGGRGTRLSERTVETPKPLLDVGGKPMIQHIIDNFVRGEFTNFIIPVGYLGNKIRNYFRSNYELIEEHDNTLDVENDKCVVEVVETGIDTMTGGRILRLKSRLTEPFMMTYGDGLSNVNPKYVKELGEELNKNIVTVIHPAPRFGAVTVSPNGEILSFSEKRVDPKEWVNGGFMYLKPEIFGYIKDDNSNFEKDCLPKVVWDSGLHAFMYEGAWIGVDTIRDLELVNEMMKEGIFTWMK